MFKKIKFLFYVASESLRQCLILTDNVKLQLDFIAHANNARMGIDLWECNVNYWIFFLFRFVSAKKSSMTFNPSDSILSYLLVVNLF